MIWLWRYVIALPHVGRTIPISFDFNGRFLLLVQGMMSVVQRAEDVEKVVESLNLLDMSLRGELAHSQAGSHGGNVDGQLQEMFQGFLVAFESYLDLDVRCYEAIKER